MRNFIKSIIIFLVPVLCYFGITITVLAIAGELSTYDNLKAYHNDDNIIVGLACSNLTKQIKLSTVEHRNSQIITLGTSRVMQFREYFFKDPSLFYNAGGAVSKIKDFRAYINNLKTKNVKVIIIGLDHYFFNRNWDDMSELPANFNNNINTLHILRNQNVFEDYFKGKINIKSLLSSNHIGLTGKIYNQGFRSDGSYFYGKMIYNPELAEDIDFKRTFQCINEGNRRFEYGQNIHERALKELNSFLQDCKSKNIRVVAFLPPYAHEVWSKLKSKENDYLYIFNLYKELKPIFDSYSYDLFDFSDIAYVGSTDDETIDGFHGSEVAYLRMLIRMGQESNALKDYVDSDALKSLLESSFSSLEVKRELKWSQHPNPI